MPRLVILVALGILAWLLVRWFMRTSPQQVTAVVRRLGLAIAVLGLGFLAITGRLNWLFVAGAAALPFLRKGLVMLRYLPVIQGLFGNKIRAANPGGQGNSFSTIETRFLRVSLDITSGNLDGEVLEGAFEGQFLSNLSLEQLLRLLQECAADPRSAALLAAYLDRHHPGWRAQAQGGGPRETPPPQGMSVEEARDILGLDANASEEDIIQAHRRLIHKLHPDRGGSNYLAAKINQAKDCLLER
ncbi:MAG TPA: molecular chaperone DnaJ [Gammaproteobacteria bacterium]|nr:molecular chaperone DnaJ [Gammaproteobacteria bacterium]